MQYRQLGNCGLEVAKLALGTLPFGGHQRPTVGNTDLAEARRILDCYIDAGGNFVDTANVYGYGRAEQTVGEIIQGRRQNLIIATKCGARMGEGGNSVGLSRRNIINSVTDSLQRLGTDYIDLYQVHSWDGKTPLEETLGALNYLVDTGKVRYIGCSNFSAWHFMKAMGLSDRLGLQRFVSHQIYYSIIGREAECELIPAAIDQGVGITVWSPLAGGLIGGRYGRRLDGPTGAEVMRGRFEPPVPDPDRIYDVLDVLEDIASTRGISLAQLGLAYLFTRPGVSSVITGPRTVAHLTEALLSCDVALSPEDLMRIDHVSYRPLDYPYWHQVRSSADRFGSADEVLLLHALGNRG